MKIIIKLIRFYQKFLTIFSYGSCRFHPTCSEYAKIQFENNSFFVAIFSSIIRILKCNQLFSGGFNYPTTRLKVKKIKFKKINVKYWLVPTADNKFFILKNWKWEKYE